MPELPDGTLTVFHTDIENSTVLTRDLREQYPAVLATHRVLLRAAFRVHDGHEVDTQGDSFFVVFPRATQAVAAAVQAQRALAAEAWPERGAVQVRIGMHTGEPVRTPEGYTGLDVIRGARVKEAGYGGQVLLSETTATLVRDALLDELALRDLGAHRLKGLPHPERIFQLVIPGLPPDFPPLHSLDARGRPRSGAVHERVLTTVVFVDIAGATELLVHLGDRQWRELRAQYFTLVRQELARWGGYEVNTVGDTVVANFDSPAAAIRYACAIRDRVQELGLKVQVSVHAGEVEREEADLTGLTVFAGARISSLAQPGEVLVSRIVCELVARSGIVFTDRGTHSLKGIPGQWQLFAVEG